MATVDSAICMGMSARVTTRRRTVIQLRFATQSSRARTVRQGSFRLRAEVRHVAHGLKELLRVEKEPVRRAVYHATRVRVPSRACRRVRAFKPNSRHTTQ